MTTITLDDQTALHAVLDPWKSAVDAHDPEAVAGVFTEEAIFQGLHQSVEMYTRVQAQFCQHPA